MIKNKKNIIFTFLALFVLVSAILWISIDHLNNAQNRGGNFQLHHRDASWELSQNSKKLNLLYFGYAACPDVCPLSMSTAGKAFRELLKEEAEQVQFIFVGVDADHQSPNQVADYAGQFYKGFVGLSGSIEEIDRVVNQFGASYVVIKDPGSYLGYSISHTDKIFILDQKGRIIQKLDHPRDSKVLVEAIRKELK